MAMLMIRCPSTGRHAFTGIETSAESLTFIPPINTRLHCPCCGDTHIWSILDAELVMGELETAGEIPLEWHARLAKL